MLRNSACVLGCVSYGCFCFFFFFDSLQIEYPLSEILGSRNKSLFLDYLPVQEMSLAQNSCMMCYVQLVRIDWRWFMLLSVCTSVWCGRPIKWDQVWNCLLATCIQRVADFVEFFFFLIFGMLRAEHLNMTFSVLLQ